MTSYKNFNIVIFIYFYQRFYENSIEYFIVGIMLNPCERAILPRAETEFNQYPV